MTINVNGVSISESEILMEMQHHPAATREAALSAASEALIVRELLRQRAVDIGLLAPSEVSPEDEERAFAAAIDRDVVSPIADDETLRRWYDAHTTEFNSPILFEASHILIACVEREEEPRLTAKEFARSLIRVLELRPEAFAELARLHSACSSGSSGGSLGQLSVGEVAPELETFLLELEDQQLCPVPVETEHGFHVLRLDRRIAPRQMAFEDATALVKAKLERLSRQRAIAQYIAVLAGESRIEGYAFASAQSPMVQ